MKKTTKTRRKLATGPVQYEQYHGARAGEKWTSVEMKLLRRYYPGYKTHDLSVLLGRTVGSIVHEAVRSWIRKYVKYGVDPKKQKSIPRLAYTQKRH